jgi:beta-glucanase (GH16 family)
MVAGSSQLLREGISHMVGTIKSKRPILYGFFEARVKVPRSKVSSAFWLYDHSAVTWQEIDVFEVCGLPPCNALYNTNIHWGVGRDQGGKWVTRQDMVKLPVEKIGDDDYFIAALEWTREHIKWFLNGVEVRTVRNDNIHSPLYIIFDNEVMKDWFGIPASDELPAVFAVDYLRVWRKK